MSDGKFFDKLAGADAGNSFRDLPGREKGDFNKAAMSDYGPGAGAATTGSAGGLFGAGQSAAGGPGASAYGTGDGKKPKKKADKPAGTVKKAELQDGAEGHGWHRPTSDQPRDLDASGSRFLQDEHGAGTVSEGMPSSGLKGVKKPQLQKQASDTYTVPRFMGTSLEKKARSERGVGEAASEHARGVGPGARDAGKRLLSSGEKGATGVIDWAAHNVKKGVNTVTNSPGLSLLALLGGGAAVLRGGKRLLGGAARAVSRKKKVQGLIPKARKLLMGK